MYNYWNVVKGYVCAFNLYRVVAHKNYKEFIIFTHKYSFCYRICQIELKQRIESLTEELQRINEALQYPMETDSYVKKLINAKHKITIVSNILQTTQERLNKVHQAVEKSTAKRKTLLDNSSAYSSTTVDPDKEESTKAEADKQQ